MLSVKSAMKFWNKNLMKKIFPEKLKSGDMARVITPARSLAMSWTTDELKEVVRKRFEELGLKLTFTKHVNDIDDFNSSPIEKRVSDLHEAFRDKSVKLVIAVIGEFNSNQLLRYLDYDFRTYAVNNFLVLGQWK